MSMLTPNDLFLLADKCSEISDDIANQDGFVPVRSLVDRFDADLILRPLLVEGMLASVQSGPHKSLNEGSIRQWAVFLDSETYNGVTESDIENEIAMKPLPPRMRNTIAHELVHSFAFRATEFGVKLKKGKNSEKSQRDFVNAIEEETEKLSPLLLIPYKYLDSLFPNEKRDISITDIQIILKHMGVSRYVFINRLKLLRLLDKKDILYRPGLRNIAIGIGIWSSNQEVRLKSWPVFVNFDKNIIPDFLAKLSSGKLSRITDYFKDPSFCLCGGSEYFCETTVLGGTTQTPGSKEMKLACFIEPNTREKKSEFLFLIKSI